MTCLRPDYGIVGEGDQSFPALIEALEAGGDLGSVPGLTWFEDNELKRNPQGPLPDLDEIPFQAIDLIDFERYKRNRCFFGVITRRGCTQRCLFCNDEALHGSRLRLRSPARVADEIEHIKAMTGMRYFQFADALFNSPRHHMVAILEEIVRRDLKIRFMIELNPIGQDEPSIKLLKQAGCVGVDFTADAGSAKMLKSLNKGFTKEQVLKVAHLYVKHKLPYTMGFLLGGPGEDIQTVEETIEFATSLPKPHVVYFGVGLTILPGSDLAVQAGDRGLLKAQEQNFAQHYHLSEGFDQACADRLLQACRDNPGFYLCELFESPVMDPFYKLCDVFNFRPTWKHRRLANISMKVLQRLKDPIYWNDEARRFQLR